MSRFLLKRAIGLVFVLFAVTLMTFVAGYFGPGDPVSSLMGFKFDPALHARLLHAYGLDLPWWQQYYNFIANALHGTFGLSFQYEGRSAWDVLKEGLPYSMELGLEILLVQVVLGVPSGILAALRANTRVDTTMTSIAIALLAIPDIALIVAFQVAMVWLYQRGLPSLPVAGWDSWQSRLAPVLITATTGFGFFTRLTRTSVLEVLRMDYIRTARSKGLIERVVVTRHMLRNALIPLLTAIGPSFAFVVTGVFITEQFFNIPGVSVITLTALSQKDYPVIQATTVLTATSVVLFNALTDIAYSIVDPRIRAE